MKDGYGAELLSKPQFIADMVQQVRNKIPNPFTVSVKIRLKENMRLKFSKINYVYIYKI